MADDFSRQAILDFMDYLGGKGLMNKSTVASRKAAANTLLSILDEDEARDLRNLDLDGLVQRFSNLKGKSFKPESLRVYKGRLANVLKDFKNYQSDPLSFRPNVASAKRTTHKAHEEASSTESANVDRTGRDKSVQETHSELVFPIPIRPDVIVSISGIPDDLTEKEAEKISKVVRALSGLNEVSDA
jgi:hypothetical protein